MRFVYFTHSLLSDWNHGNAHFLRGVLTELLARGNEIAVYEPRGAWSLENLLKDHGPSALSGFHRAYPDLDSIQYDLEALDLDKALGGADVVIVHEWNEHELVARVGEHARRARDYKLFFHDTHHRSVTDEENMAAYDLSGYDGALVFGEVIRRRYLDRGWAKDAWTWHEAADTRLFKPSQSSLPPEGDLVWIGNWGDEERTAELHEFLLEPVSKLGLKAKVFGVRYPQHALKALEEHGVEYGGWLPNYLAPEVFARYRVTVHVPRRPYVEALPGIPTIRPFEALACGIPLISAPWDDAENLFRPGQDFLVARDVREMVGQMRRVLEEPGLAHALSENGLETIRARHTCVHRVDELLEIVAAVPEAVAASGRG